MSQFLLKNIDIVLTPESIKNAIDEINRLNDDLSRALAMLAAKLMEQGVEVAKMEVAQMSAVYTGDLYENIFGFYNETTHTGVIFVDESVKYAVYVEYGTGMVGAWNPHPQAGELGINYGANHGYEGWVYKNDRDGEWYWTRGMPARPFMYNTMRDLEVEAERRGGRIIAEYIP